MTMKRRSDKVLLLPTPQQRSKKKKSNEIWCDMFNQLYQIAFALINFWFFIHFLYSTRVRVLFSSFFCNFFGNAIVKAIFWWMVEWGIWEEKKRAESDWDKQIERKTTTIVAWSEILYWWQLQLIVRYEYN